MTMGTSYTNTVLEAISRKLNEGINDRTTVTITIFIVIAVIVVLYLVLKFRARRNVLESAEASYQKLIRKFNLTILELDLLDKLAETQRKKEEKYHLLIYAGTFRQAAKKVLLSESEEELLQGLKAKLGFASVDEGPETSTSKIHPGTPVKIVFENGEHIDAEIYSNAEANITVKYDSGQRPVSAGEKILLVSPALHGLNIFMLVPDRIKGELFSAPHAEPLKRDKTNIKIGLVLKKEEDEKPLEHRAVLLRITDTGAVITDTESFLRIGETVSAYLDNDRKQLFGFKVEVIKISEEKKLASVLFAT